MEERGPLSLSQVASGLSAFYMAKITVQSSLLKSLELDAATAIMSAEFHNGDVLDYPGTTAEEFGRVLSSPSVGSAFMKVFGKRPKTKRPRETFFDGTKAAPAETIALKEPLPLGPLETFAFDPCCGGRLQRAKRDGLSQWDCPACGAVWKWQMRGTLKHWQPEVAHFMLRV